MDRPARCLVCGLDYSYDPSRPTIWRDENTGEVINDVMPVSDRADLFVFGDGAVAAVCIEHSADEARTAFVLAEIALTFVPAAMEGDANG